MQVLSCRFLRLECSGEEHPLFQREYTRSNRERGVKLLRCFPHCCPEHVKRSYCGCSVQVLVTFSADVSAAALGDFVVCARFEPSRVAPLWPAALVELARDVGAAGDGGDESKQDEERGLDIGESVALPASLFDATTAAADESTVTSSGWIRARRETSERHRAFPKNAALYVFKQGRSPKWMYSYDSSVTRAQREMTHHLVAYVFLMRPAVSASGEQERVERQPDSRLDCDAVVLGRHASPAFLLVSYRRARARPDTVSDSNGRAINISTDSTGGALSDVHGTSTFQQYSSWQREQSQFLEPREAERSAGYDDMHWDQDISTEISDSDAVGSEAGDDSSMWQTEAELHAPGFLDKVRNLLILWQFLQCVSLEDAGLRSEAAKRCIRSHWLQVATTLRISTLNFGVRMEDIIDSFLNAISEHASTLPPPEERNDETDRERTVVLVTASLFLRALSSDHVQRLFCSAFREDASMTSMKQLRGRFVLLVLELYNYICGELQEIPAGIYEFEPETHDTPLTALLDDILSLVYGCTHFGELRRGISALLMDTNTPASLAATLNRVYQKFTAHVYRVTTASAVSTMTRHGYNSTQNAWSRRWLLDPGSVDIIDLRTGNQDAYADLRLVDVTQVVCALGCVDVTTDADMSSVSLRSAVLLSGNTPVIRTELILDGRQHIYSAQSIGLFSILAGRRSVGEYAGSFSANGRSLHLDYFYLEEECQSSTGDAHAGSASVSSSGLETQENEEIFDGATMVRRVKLTLSLDHGPDSGVLSCCSDCRDLSVLVHAVTSVATFETSTPTTEWQGSEGSFLGLASTSRAALEWIQVTELQAGYIAVSCRASGS